MRVGGLPEGMDTQSSLSPLPLHLSTSEQNCDPGEIAWVGGSQWEKPNLNSFKAREPERKRQSIYLENSKISYNNNNLFISSHFHLRISESLWNSLPTMCGIVIIISPQTRELRGWVFYDCPAGWLRALWDSTACPWFYVLIFINIKNS